MTTLRPQHQLFVQEFLVDFNATEAAKRAKYSIRSAGQIGFALLKKHEIQEAIAERQQELADKIKVTQEMIVAEYAHMGFANMRDYATWGPDGVTLKDSSELSQGAAAAVMEVSETTIKDGGTVKFKLHDKKGALDSLAKHLGMFIERQEITVETREPIKRLIIMMPSDGKAPSDPYPDEPKSLQNGHNPE